MEKYDAIIIGSGQGGMPLARALAKAGWKTAMIEQKHVGGTCINEGCTPTKTMVASAEAVYMARRAKNFGVQAGNVSVNMQAIYQRKQDIVNSFRNGDERRLINDGVQLIWGRASFIGPKSIEVSLNNGGEPLQMTAETIVINTGGRSRPIKLDGLEQIPYLDSTSILDLTELPDHLLIIGGSYVALEFGQMFRRFGSQVTIIQRSGCLLGREDVDVAEAVLGIIRDDGIQVLLNAETRQVERDSAGKIHLKVTNPEGDHNLVCSHLLLAAGRIPNSDRLNLPAAGIETDPQGYIRTNERLETNVPGVYAIGDVKGGPAFTHISYDDFRILKKNLLEKGNASILGRMIPYTMFIDPQLGRIGMIETDARKQFLNLKVAKIPMSYIARALETDQARGFIKALVDMDTQQIVGGAVLGADGGEIMAMIQIAMLGKLPYTVLRDATFAHPTFSEGLNTLFADLP
ncbi:MAG TPA: mercuric reductase [Anaerolineaceae bacterium]|nr:mercuric reductase [Anaerolineaceae bacterium]